jgi:hypothetical protein
MRMRMAGVQEWNKSKLYPKRLGPKAARI